MLVSVLVVLDVSCNERMLMVTKEVVPEVSVLVVLDVSCNTYTAPSLFSKTWLSLGRLSTDTGFSPCCFGRFL